MSHHAASVSKQTRTRQKSFFKQCIESSQTLDEIMADNKITFETLAGWLGEIGFRTKLHAMEKCLRRITRFQVELGALRASAMLLRISGDTAIHNPKPMARSASVDLIRLARDSHARAVASNPTVDDVTKNRAIYHPGVPAEEARELIEALAQKDASKSQQPTPSPS